VVAYRVSSGTGRDGTGPPSPSRRALASTFVAHLEDLHEWVSFDDPDEDRTWVFDVTFLTSPWTCIFGQGCPGVLTGPAPELVHGCCSYGAHFTGQADIDRTVEMAERLTDEQWQFRKVAKRRGGVVKRTAAGEDVTRLVRDACIFLNRPEFPGGAGCALHRAALEAGERPLDWKPDVCWQLPLRLEEETDPYGHVTSTLREWKRRDWGAGGFEFHWWCTDDPEAFVGRRPVYEELRDEIIELVGAGPYRSVVRHLKDRVRERSPGAVNGPTSGRAWRGLSRRPESGPSTTEVFLPHPALRPR
jgi:hypothetical protein